MKTTSSSGGSVVGIRIANIVLPEPGRHISSIFRTVINAAIDMLCLAADAKAIRIQVVMDFGAGIVLGDPCLAKKVAFRLCREEERIKFTTVKRLFWQGPSGSYGDYNVTPQKIPVGFGPRSTKITLPACEAGRSFSLYTAPFN
jgi:hypothetical protein